MMKSKFFKGILAAGMFTVSAFAAETLFSNYALNVNAASETGKLWVFSRGDIYSGVTLLTLNASEDGVVRVENSVQEQFPDSLTAKHDALGSYIVAEHRRTPSTLAGKLGYVLPAFGLDDEGLFLKPEGFFFSIRNVDNVVNMPLAVPEAFEDSDSAMVYAMSGFAYDSSAKKLWIARGSAGLGLYDNSSSGYQNYTYALDLKNSTLDLAKENYRYSSDKNPDVFGVAVHPETGELWMATSKGLWKRASDGSVKKASSVLDSARVTGIWVGGNPLQVIAETSYMKGESMKGALWRLALGAKDFAKVDFLDTAGKAVKNDVYDEGDYTVSDVAFVGNAAFVAVRAVNSQVSGYFKVDSSGVRAWDMDDDGRGLWLYGYETGATNRDFIITSICSFPLSKKTTGLALATNGNGISVSADSGKTWNSILNRAKLGDNLGSVRMVPSVIVAGGESLVSYKVNRDAKVTIDVFSYDMRKIRTIVKDAPRYKDNSRSTNPKEDFWDGYDKAGRPCTMGVYYVRVKDNHGNVGWGKVMTIGGHK